MARSRVTQIKNPVRTLDKSIATRAAMQQMQPSGGVKRAKTNEKAGSFTSASSHFKKSVIYSSDEEEDADLNKSVPIINSSESSDEEDLVHPKFNSESSDKEDKVSKRVMRDNTAVNLDSSSDEEQ